MSVSLMEIDDGPGAVNEYVKIFASGIAMSDTPYKMIRVS